ncbi:MAG: hypothetical protein OIF50_10745 [Flavobacteriaceae bacterium]|nr:hypothetical protein [Flavobacteriaceae bacterium]
MKAFLEYIVLREEVLLSEIEFYRHIKWHGRPATRVLGGKLRVGMSASQHSGLFVEELLKIDPQVRDPEQEDPAYSEWFKEVLLKIYQDDGQAFRTYRLLDGHIKNYRALFSSFYPIQDDNNHIIYIEFASATQIINDSTKNQFEWYITPFKPKEYQPAVKAFEGEDRKLVDYYLTNVDGERITEACIGDKVVLNIQTQNYTGGKLNINLNHDNVDFKYNGKIVKNDILQNQIIDNDHIKIELTVYA